MCHVVALVVIVLDTKWPVSEFSLLLFSITMLKQAFKPFLLLGSVRYDAPGA